jgi:hypothetical protein
VTLTLLVRAYCHLCDEMAAGLEPLLASRRVAVEVIDVDADPAREARWGDRVPVLLSGDEELCHYRLDAVAVSRWLEQATGAVSR